MYVSKQGLKHQFVLVLWWNIRLFLSECQTHIKRHNSKYSKSNFPKENLICNFCCYVFYMHLAMPYIPGPNFVIFGRTDAFSRPQTDSMFAMSSSITSFLGFPGSIIKTVDEIVRDITALYVLTLFEMHLEEFLIATNTLWGIFYTMNTFV